MSFDTDTGLAEIGERRWRGEISERWFVGRGPNGGLLAAQAARAMRALAPESEQEPRSLTLHYLAAPTAGPIEIEGRVEREGRSTTSVSLRFEQEGRTVALALGALARWRPEGLDHLAATPPDVPPPESLEPVDPALAGLPPFVANYDWRFAIEPGLPDTARVGGWIKTASPRPVDHVSVAAFSDAFFPAVFPVLGDFTAFAPTLDLTVHFRAPLHELGDAWVLGAFRSRRAAGGFFEEDGELWTEGGLLIAQSRQLAMLRPAR